MIFVVKEEDKGLYREIKGRIRRLQSGGTLDSIARLGVDTAGQNGASFYSLHDLARGYEKNQVVARMLWGDHLREEQIVALFLLPNLSEGSPEEKNPETAMKKSSIAENDAHHEVKDAFATEVNALVAEAVSLEVAEYAGSQWIATLRNCEELLQANFEIPTLLAPTTNSKTATESSTTPATKTKATSKSEIIDNNETQTTPSTTTTTTTSPLNVQLLIGVAMIGAASKVIAREKQDAPEIAKQWILRHYDDSYLEMLAERQRIRF